MRKGLRYTRREREEKIRIEREGVGTNSELDRKTRNIRIQR